MLRTNLPDGYLEAEPGEIKKYCKEAGVKSVAPDFFQDLLNIARKGDVQSEEQVERGVRGILEAQPHLDREKLLRYHDNVRKFLSTLVERGTMDSLPGSAIEKAAALLRMMANKSGGRGQTGSEEFPLPIFVEKNEGLGEKTADVLEAVQNLDKIDQDFLEIEKPEQNKPLAVVKAAEEIGMKVELEIVRLSHLLEDLSELKTQKKKSIKSSAVPTRIVRSRGIKGLHELTKVHRVSFGLPDEIFWQRAVERRLPVREYVEVEEKKQLIYFLLDSSGSMDGGRIERASGILLNRVKAVIRGEAEMFLRLFDSSPHEIKQARTKEEGRALLSYCRDTGLYNGGGTDFTAALQTAVKDITSDQQKYHQCDIVMVTDGEDSVGQIDLRGIKLHVFSVSGKNNEELEELSTNFWLVDDNMGIKKIK